MVARHPLRYQALRPFQNQQQLPAPPPLGGGGMSVEDTLLYLDDVKREFGDRSRVYNEFLSIIKEFKNNKVDTSGVIEKVSKLFRGHTKLILGFNKFLPDGYKLTKEDLDSRKKKDRKLIYVSWGMKSCFCFLAVLWLIQMTGMMLTAFHLIDAAELWNNVNGDVQPLGPKQLFQQKFLRKEKAEQTHKNDQNGQQQNKPHFEPEKETAPKNKIVSGARVKSDLEEMGKQLNGKIDNNNNHEIDGDLKSKMLKAASERLEANKSKPKKKMQRPNWKPNPYGFGVKPNVMLQKEENRKLGNYLDRRQVPENQMLAAYLEETDQSQWETRPLPSRTPKAADLTKRQYPRLNSCSKLMEQWPVDDSPVDEDPFLPWIHDVFPTHDGKFIQFVAQNKNRCHTGTTDEEEAILHWMKPQTALFEHIPLKRLSDGRYRLSSHEDADPESVSTRFICKFKPSGDITFSSFNNDYEWVSYRKGQRKMFERDGRDIKQIHTSQLLFKCPVPPALQEKIRDGSSVVDDWASIFVDVIPIRSPPRYGYPGEFLPPKYDERKEKNIKIGTFDPQKEWGVNHILPDLEDSGRWINIPICKPSLMTYEPKALEIDSVDPPAEVGEFSKKHHLVSCLWASAGYTTRGHRFAINDGQRRLIEWITFNKMLGFDHFYIYDNTAAFTAETSLQPVANMFPEDVTIVKWPSKVCNNNPNNVDSPGERSSQYAAESSCQLRFGPHVKWIGQFDIDEYLVPMGNYTSLLPLLSKLDEEGTKILSFGSWRSWPRATHVKNIEPINNRKLCDSKFECFELEVKKNTTMLEAYNCDRQKPGEKQKQMPAEKQIYRADYVTQHFIHYSTVTKSTLLSVNEFNKAFPKARAFPDPLSRFGDEVNEGLMIHSKAVARQDTAGWVRNCHKNHTGFSLCRLGYPYPPGGDADHGPAYDEDGWNYNCFVNEKIDNYWAPRLAGKLKEIGVL